MCDVGKSSSEVHVLLSETCGTYDMMKSDVLKWHKSFRRARRMWKILKERVIQEHTDLKKVLKWCGTFFV